MNTNFTNVRIEGIGNIRGGEYGKLTVSGVGNISGDIKFERLDIEGTCRCKGNLDGNMLDVEGVFTTGGDIRVKRLDISGVVTTKNRKIYADEVNVDGILKNDDEVNADKVMIEGCVKLNDLFGDKITINYDSRSFGVFSIGNSFRAKMNVARNIECSELVACNITCRSICATDIYLSDHCHVDRIQCNGTLHYDRTCVIKHIEGDYKENLHR